MKGQSPVTESGITFAVKVILVLAGLLILFLFFPTVLYGASEWISTIFKGG